VPLSLKCERTALAVAGSRALATQALDAGSAESTRAASPQPAAAPPHDGAQGCGVANGPSASGYAQWGKFVLAVALLASRRRRQQRCLPVRTGAGVA
jgi:MYXO-CTERM domain-containing protein